MTARDAARTPARTGHVRGDGLSLRYREWGVEESGEPAVVLLHGITGSAADWDAVAALLAPARRVLAIDARGHGASQWSAEEEYAADHHFADLVVALNALQIERVVVAGFSMGGAVATMYAASAPERTAGLVVVDAYPAPEMSPGSRRVAETLAMLYRAGALPGDFDPAIARRMAEDLEAGDARRLDLWPFWESVEAPSLVVRGGESDVLTERLADEMIARQPRSKLLTLAGAGHQIPSQRPRELAAAIRSLLV